MSRTLRLPSTSRSICTALRSSTTCSAGVATSPALLVARTGTASSEGIGASMPPRRSASSAIRARNSPAVNSRLCSDGRPPATNANSPSVSVRTVASSAFKPCSLPNVAPTSVPRSKLSSAAQRALDKRKRPVSRSSPRSCTMAGTPIPPRVPCSSTMPVRVRAVQLSRTWLGDCTWPAVATRLSRSLGTRRAEAVEVRRMRLRACAANARGDGRAGDRDAVARV